MERFCRACLIQYDNPMELLQYTEKNRRLFVYSTGIQVKRNDAFTFQLCKECFLNMKVACKFKKLCRSSDKRFKNYIALKDEGVPIDFCTFLKNNEEPFRFPLLSANNTPVHQKIKDDDNESTCTSIRNFMSDILQGEEMPDTEARIIREVIEEEADLLDDSLDSHWLQDDMSIDTDFRLDFSFSAFSTPQSVNNDNSYTPKRPENQPHKYAPIFQEANKSIFKQVTKSDIKTEFNEYNNYEDKSLSAEDKPSNALLIKTDEYFDFTQVNGNCEKLLNDSNEEVNLNISIDPLEAHTNEFETPIEPNTKVINAQNFYLPQENDTLNSLIDLKDYEKECSIDRNLAIALKDQNNQEFSLDELLVSPAYQNNGGASTPTINNILFGDKIDLEDSNQLGQCIEKYDNVQGDMEILEEFFQNDTKNIIKQLTIEKENPEIESNHVKVPSIEIFKKPIIKLEKKTYDLENFVCYLCNKKFAKCFSLNRHFNKQHKIKLPKQTQIQKNPNHYSTAKMCPFCGKMFIHRCNFHRHLKSHNKKPDTKQRYKCNECQLECTSKAKLSLHMQIHSSTEKAKPEKKYLCPICSATFSNSANLCFHKRRHTKNYRHSCDICDKQFYFPSELVAHMRNHTGEHPYHCKQCPHQFKRSSGLFRHVRRHHSTEKFECHHCGEQFIQKINLVGHFRRSKSCRMVTTIKPKRKPNPKKQKTNQPINILFNTKYATRDNETILSQLPFIDTERSN